MQDRPVIIRPAPFRAPKVMQAPHGATVRQMVDAMYEASGVPAVMRTYQLDVEIDGVMVPRSAWSGTVPDVNAHVLILAPVHGGGNGKNPLRTILSIVVVIVAAIATIVAPYGAPAWWTSASGLGLSASSFGYIAGMAVMTAGMLLVNAIAPIRAESGLSAASGNQSYADSPTYSLSGAQNSANPFGPIPVVLGKHRMYPPYGAKPYTELIGNDEYLRMLFIWGYGPLKIEDIKIGETPITSFSGVTIETVEGWPDDDPITLFPADVYQDAIGVELVQASGRVIRTAQDGADELSVDVSFPQGLAQFDAYANRTAYTVILKIEYREVGDPDWIDISTTLQVAAKVFQPPPVSGYDFVMSEFIVSSFPILTYSIYVSEAGSVFMQQGQSDISGSYRIGEAYRTYTDGFGSAMTTVVTALSSAYVTGCVCSALEDGTINVTAGTVTPPSLEITAATSSTIRRNRHWLVDRTKRYEVAVSRTTADTDDTKIIDTVYWTSLRSITHIEPGRTPQQRRKAGHQNRRQDGRRRIPTRKAVYEPFDRSALCLRLLDQTHNATDDRISGRAGGPHLNGCLTVDRAAKHLIADGARHRRTFTRHRGLVDQRHAGHDAPVYRNVFAGAHQHRFPHLHLLHIHNLLVRRTKRTGPAGITISPQMPGAIHARTQHRRPVGAPR